ncbi:MAG: tetratricopeptide repeat protein [Lachnospiraceae bacterium]|nr:tetratricopeptide repeat protein [Lachnospiraceae bacterium]
MEPELKKSNKKIVIIIVAIVVVIAIAVSIGVVVYSGSPARRLQQQLDLGARYLSELDYEQAVAAYEAALEIDPKSADAYLGLINTCLAAGDADGLSEAYTRAQAAGLTEDDMMRVEAAYQIAIATLSAGNETGDSNTEEAGDTEPEFPPLPEEYVTIVQALLDLKNLTFCDIAIKDWRREDVDTIIQAYGLEEDDTFASPEHGVNSGYYYRPAGIPYPDGHLFFCVYKNRDFWSVQYAHNTITSDGGWKHEGVAHVHFQNEPEEGSSGKSFLFESGKFGIDRFGPLVPFSLFFEEHEGSSFYSELMAGDGGYKISEESEIRWRLHGDGGAVTIEIQEEEETLELYLGQPEEGIQRWVISFE